MKNKISIVLFSSLLVIVLSSFISTPVPDPEIFGKEFIETIKKKSRDAYINKYSISKEDFTWTTTQISGASYIPEELKKSYQEYLLKDSSFNKEVRRHLSENYDAIEAWIKKDTIDISQLSYVQTFYDIKYIHNMVFNAMDEGAIFVKYKSSYYTITIGRVLFINNKWVYGENLRITKVDKYLKQMPGERTADAYDEVAYDTVAVVAEAVEDSIIVHDEYSLVQDELVIDNNASRYSGLNPKQAKKIEKMQKQIDALYKKMDTEYSKEY